jgi:hypothetical protein
MNAKRPTSEEIQKVLEIFRAKEKERREFAEKYGDMKPLMVIKAGDKLMTAIEGGLYMQTREGPYNFINILHDHALLFFGEPYLEEEETKPLEQRHPALQWMYRLIEHRQKLERDGQTDQESDQLGVGAAWLRFAYDLYTIRDNAKLQTRMRERLLSKKDFQGARHELRVAALCVAAGFNIEFENDRDNTIGHAEFIGTDKSGIKIAVEVKSRHRHGVQGFEGGKQLKPGSKVSIRDIVLDAYKKKTGLPLYVFIDANLPPTESQEQLLDWMREIHDTMSDLEKESFGDTCPANVTFISNDPSHYLEEKQINNDTDHLWIMHFESTDPRVPHPAPDMTIRLKRAYTQRIAPPDEIPNFNS